MKVYCVAWEYWYGQCGGGGFDWYYSAEDADKAFEAEKEYADSADTTWDAVRFDAEVTSAETATEEIDHRLPELFDAATIRYKHEVTPD